MTTIREEVLQAVGQASVCWTADHVFEPDKAVKVADNLIERLGLDPDDKLACRPTAPGQA